MLFFLTPTPPAAAGAGLIERARRSRASGAFEHLFGDPGWSLRAITWINRIRYRITRNWYGDQGIFVRAGVFRALGGYRDLRLLEDLDFSRRLKRRGRSVLVQVPLRTSGRRFLARGPWRTFFMCWWLVGRHTLGLDTERYAERWRGPSLTLARRISRCEAPVAAWIGGPVNPPLLVDRGHGFVGREGRAPLLAPAPLDALARARDGVPAPLASRRRWAAAGMSA